MTYTVATMNVSAATHAEIKRLLKAAGYDHAIGADGSLDMTHIALVTDGVARCDGPLEITLDEMKEAASRMTDHVQDMGPMFIPSIILKREDDGSLSVNTYDKLPKPIGHIHIGVAPGKEDTPFAELGPDDLVIRATETDRSDTIKGDPAAVHPMCSPTTKGPIGLYGMPFVQIQLPPPPDPMAEFLRDCDVALRLRHDPNLPNQFIAARCVHEAFTELRLPDLIDVPASDEFWIDVDRRARELYRQCVVYGYCT